MSHHELDIGERLMPFDLHGFCHKRSRIKRFPCRPRLGHKTISFEIIVVRGRSACCALLCLLGLNRAVFKVRCYIFSTSQRCLKTRGRSSNRHASIRSVNGCCRAVVINSMILPRRLVYTPYKKRFALCDQLTPTYLSPCLSGV